MRIVLCTTQRLGTMTSTEALRVAYPGEEYDWLHLTGFIHDLGKVLGHPKMFNQPQWAVVGDTFPTGCAYAPDIIFSEFFLENPDMTHPVYSTKVRQSSTVIPLLPPREQHRHLHDCSRELTCALCTVRCVRAQLRPGQRGDVVGSR
jgi:hypothetical protein